MVKRSLVTGEEWKPNHDHQATGHVHSCFKVFPNHHLFIPFQSFPFLLLQRSSFPIQFSNHHFLVRIWNNQMNPGIRMKKKLRPKERNHKLYRESCKKFLESGERERVTNQEKLMEIETKIETKITQDLNHISTLTVYKKLIQSNEKGKQKHDDQNLKSLLLLSPLSPFTHLLKTT